MQRLYHSVSGDALEQLSELVDLAAAGEICVSEDCLAYIGSRGEYKDIHDCGGARLLMRLELEVSLQEILEKHVEKSLSDRLLRRNKDIEEGFIHPRVLRLSSHGGLTPTQIAQMRNFFIAMTSISRGGSVNWLMEVQGVLDKQRCPILQIIDDDKGSCSRSQSPRPHGVQRTC